MNPRVKAVRANADYTLTLLFTNGETRRFDVKPYLDRGTFTELRDPGTFNSVKPFLGSIQWRGGQDLCPDTLYEGSEPSDDLKGHVEGHRASAVEPSDPRGDRSAAKE